MDNGFFTPILVLRISKIIEEYVIVWSDQTIFLSPEICVVITASIGSHHERSIFFLVSRLIKSMFFFKYNV